MTVLAAMEELAGAWLAGTALLDLFRSVIVLRAGTIALSRRESLVLAPGRPDWAAAVRLNQNWRRPCRQHDMVPK